MQAVEGVEKELKRGMGEEIAQEKQSLKQNYEALESQLSKIQSKFTTQFIDIASQLTASADQLKTMELTVKSKNKIMKMYVEKQSNKAKDNLESMKKEVERGQIKLSDRIS